MPSNDHREPFMLDYTETDRRIMAMMNFQKEQFNEQVALYLARRHLCPCPFQKPYRMRATHAV